MRTASSATSSINTWSRRSSPSPNSTIVLALGGEAPEAVGTVAVVRIVGAVDQRRPQGREGRSMAALAKHQLARQVHDAVQAVRRGRRTLR